MKLKSSNAGDFELDLAKYTKIQFIFTSNLKWPLTSLNWTIAAVLNTNSNKILLLL